MNLDSLLKAATSHVETVKVTRAGINPLLWILGLVAPPAMFLSVWVGDGWFRIALFGLAAATTLIAIVGYFVVLFLRPEMLQSEDYLLRREALFMNWKQGASPETLEAASKAVRSERGRGRRRDGERR